MDEFDGLGQSAVGTVLRPALADAAQFARHLHDPAALAQVVADWFLDIDILARLHGPDRRQGVPMVRRRDEHRGDGLVIKNHAQVLDGLRLGTLPGDEVRGDLSRAIAIRVADARDLAVREAGQFVGVLLAANAATEDGHGNLVIGADRPLFR